MSAARTFPVLLEAFFMDRLMAQRQASPHTVASYRDAFHLLLMYAQRQLHKEPSGLTLQDLDAPFVGSFLDHLERERDNSTRSRNVRLAAIHSFFRYVALHAPEHSALAQRVLAMPSKRHLRRPISFLTSVEVAALLAAPGSRQLGRASRSGTAVAGRADGVARRRTPRPSMSERCARSGGVCAMPGQGAKGPQHPAPQRYRGRVARLAGRAPRPTL